MPLYEFKCTKCKSVFEEFVSVGQKTHKCPSCGGRGKKLISSVGIIFKGSGWYCKDNNRPGPDGNGSKHKKTETEKVKSDKVESEKSDAASTSKDSKED